MSIRYYNTPPYNLLRAEGLRGSNFGAANSGILKDALSFSKHISRQLLEIIHIHLVKKTHFKVIYSLRILYNLAKYPPRPKKEIPYTMKMAAFDISPFLPVAFPSKHNRLSKPSQTARRWRGLSLPTLVWKKQQIQKSYGPAHRTILANALI